MWHVHGPHPQPPLFPIPKIFGDGFGQPPPTASIFLLLRVKSASDSNLLPRHPTGPSPSSSTLHLLHLPVLSHSRFLFLLPAREYNLITGCPLPQSTRDRTLQLLFRFTPATSPRKSTRLVYHWIPLYLLLYHNRLLCLQAGRLALLRQHGHHNGHSRKVQAPGRRSHSQAHQAPPIWYTPFPGYREPRSCGGRSA